MAHFEYSSVIPTAKNSVFEFICNIKNLPLIMPPDYKIELTSPPSSLKKGEEYEIKVSRFGISVVMNMTLEEAAENEMIRERQSQGPFSQWIHTHKVDDHGEGTLMTDIIDFDVSFGILGKLAQDLFINRDLERIFRFRHEKTITLLNKEKKLEA